MRALGTLAALAAMLALGAASASAASGDGLAAARAGTAKFHSNAAAQAAGYGLLVDAAGIACIDNPAGGMGIHYVNGALVGDDRVDAATPELVVYEPEKNGKLRLVAAEYVVFQDAWDATHTSAPALFGQEFELVGGRQPLRAPAVLRAARLAVEAQPGGHVRRLEPEGHLPVRSARWRGDPAAPPVSQRAQGDEPAAGARERRPGRAAAGPLSVRSGGGSTVRT